MLIRKKLDHTGRLGQFKYIILMFALVVVLHFSVKAVGDKLLEGMTLESDPHLFAIGGGWAMTTLVSLLFLAFTISPSRWQPWSIRKKPEQPRAGSSACKPERRSTWTIALDWGAKDTDSVLSSCANPHVAELVAFHCRRFHENVEVLDIRMYDYIKVHCALGKWRHLETVYWQRATGRVIPFSRTTSNAAVKDVDMNAKVIATDDIKIRPIAEVEQ